jgi:hypothetical protein
MYWTEQTVNQRPLQTIIQSPASQKHTCFLFIKKEKKNIGSLHNVKPIYYSDNVIKLPISHQKGVIIFLK